MTMAAAAGEIEAFTRRPEWKHLLTLGQRFEQVVLRLVGSAFAAINAEHAFELALTEVANCPAHAQVNVKGCGR